MSAQQVESAFSWESESLLSFQSTASLEEQVFVGGIFRDQFLQSATTINSVGKNDIFLAQIDENGNPIWLQSGGSAQNDELKKIVATNDQIYVTGTYWVTGQFDEVQLQAKRGNKSIFFLNYSTDGDANWGVSIDGSGNKNVNDIVIDGAGNLLLTGSFTDSLFFDGRLIGFTEQQSFFLLKISSEGDFIWSKQANDIFGKVEGIAIGVSKNNEVALTGNFIGTLQIESSQVQTNTEDENVFLANFSADGEFRWLRSAGGVFPDEVVDLQYVDEEIYLTGNYFGRLEIDENLIIQSLGLNENIFLLAYDKNGEAISAYNIGDVDLERVTSMDIFRGQIVLCGFFQERMKVENFIIEGVGSELEGFVLNLDLTGNPLWLRPFHSDENLLLNEIHFRTLQQIHVIGDFTGNAQFDDFQFATSTFNPFLAEINNLTTSTKKYVPQSTDYQLHNSQDFLQISSKETIESLQIFNLQGQLLLPHSKSNRIVTTFLPNGIYILRIFFQNGSQVTRLFTKLN
ncbi:MAG: T9SS type A sorting domain-containing protein [Bacteroidota bacterium]